MALPEKPAGERLKLWIHGHQGELGQLSLGGQQTIKGVAVRHGVAASMQALLQGDRQQLKPLGCKQPGQIIEQFPGRWSSWKPWQMPCSTSRAQPTYPPGWPPTAETESLRLFSSALATPPPPPW